MNVRYRQLRGLIIHYRRSMEVRRAWARKYSWYTDRDEYYRSLIIASTVVPRSVGHKFTGLCRWCDFPVPPTKRAWCNVGCVRAYAMAQGLQRMADGRPLLSTKGAKCAKCGLEGHYIHNGRWTGYSLELDHIVSLGVAFFRGERARLRAYTLDNMQWLCRDCHKEKTADDRRRFANLKAGRPEDWRDPIKMIRDSQLTFHFE